MVQKRYSFSYEARSLIYIVQGRELQHGKKLTYGGAISLACKRVSDFMAENDIDWFDVRDYRLDGDLFDGNGDTARKRYNTDIDIPDETEEWLEELRQDLKKTYKGIVRSLYIPYVVWLVLKADYLISAGAIKDCLK